MYSRRRPSRPGCLGWTYRNLLQPKTKKPRGRVPRGFECFLLRGFYSNASNGTKAGAVRVRVKEEAQTTFHLADKIAHIAGQIQAILLEIDRSPIGSLHKRLPPFSG